MYHFWPVPAAYQQNTHQMNNYQPYPHTTVAYVQPVQPATVVVAAPAVAYNGGQVVRDHLVWSIFNLILLCPILGIVAVIFSVLSRNSKSIGKLSLFLLS